MNPLPSVHRSTRTPERMIPLRLALAAVHCALICSPDVDERDRAVRRFQDKYGPLWPNGDLLFRAAAKLVGPPITEGTDYVLP
jgi:hypothetical protein